MEGEGSDRGWRLGGGATVSSTYSDTYDICACYTLISTCKSKHQGLTIHTDGGKLLSR